MCEQYSQIMTSVACDEDWREELHQSDQNVINSRDYRRQWRDRFRAYVRSNGGHFIYKLYFAMTAANNKTHTVKGKEKKEEKHTQHTIVNIKKKSIKHTNYELKT